MSQHLERTKLLKEKTTTETRPLKRTMFGKDLTPTNVFLTKIHSTIEERQKDYINDRCMNFEKSALAMVDSIKGTSLYVWYRLTQS